MSKHPRNIRKVINHIHSLPVGAKFISRDLEPILKLPSDEIGNTVKWQPNMRIAGTIGNNINQWEKTRNYKPEELIVK